MAEEKDPTEETTDESTAKKSKRPLFLGVGMATLVGIAYLGATMAVPRKAAVSPPLAGPFVVAMTEEPMSFNLAGEDVGRFGLLRINLEYYAYDERYLADRVAETVTAAKLRDRALATGSRRTLVELTTDDSFLLELRDVLEPIAFPVHVGENEDPFGVDADSGLRPGRSALAATLRGSFHDHFLHVDGPARSVRLDDGEDTPFDGDETDLRIEDADGLCVFLDVTQYEPEFQGAVKVGVMGQLSSVLRDTYNIQ